ncbi:MAG: hypothetical protein LBM75_10160 [Myxococcales bacterium]|jgi:hypothetical protein|nr:hypothetical protein [Myxococcales bacterium]
MFEKRREKASLRGQRRKAPGFAGGSLPGPLHREGLGTSDEARGFELPDGNEERSNEVWGFTEKWGDGIMKGYVFSSLSRWSSPELADCFLDGENARQRKNGDAIQSRLHFLFHSMNDRIVDESFNRFNQ